MYYYYLCPTVRLKKCILYIEEKKRKKIFFIFFIFLYIYAVFYLDRSDSRTEMARGQQKTPILCGFAAPCAKVSVKMASRTQLDSVWQLDAKKHRRPFFSGGASYMYQLNGMSSSLIGSTGFSGLFLSGILSSGIMNLRTLIRLP